MVYLISKRAVGTDGAFLICLQSPFYVLWHLPGRTIAHTRGAIRPGCDMLVPVLALELLPFSDALLKTSPFADGLPFPYVAAQPFPSTGCWRLYSTG